MSELFLVFFWRPNIGLKYVWNSSEIFLKYWLLGILTCFWLKFCMFRVFLAFPAKIWKNYVFPENSDFFRFSENVQKFIGIYREWCVWTLPKLVLADFWKKLNFQEKRIFSRFWSGKAIKATKGSKIFIFLFLVAFLLLSSFFLLFQPKIGKIMFFLKIHFFSENVQSFSCFSVVFTFLFFSRHVFKSKITQK